MNILEQVKRDWKWDTDDNKDKWVMPPLSGSFKVAALITGELFIGMKINNFVRHIIPLHLRPRITSFCYACGSVTLAVCQRK